MSPRTFFASMFFIYALLGLNHIYTKDYNATALAAYTAYTDSLSVEYPNMALALNTIEVSDPVYIDPRELRCLQENIYWEARNQKSREALAAVAYVTLNRVEHESYPNSLCKVVRQAMRDDNGVPLLNKCQFSWNCDGRNKLPNLRHKSERLAWERAGRIAEKTILGDIENPVDDALFYHADYVNPKWANSFVKVVKIESHIFYAKT